MNHYQYLGVPPEASSEAVRDAAQVARKRWQLRLGAAADDRARARAEAALARIAEAEAVLTDPGRRSAYDRQLRGTEPEEPASPRQENEFGPGRSGDAPSGQPSAEEFPGAGPLPGYWPYGGWPGGVAPRPEETDTDAGGGQSSFAGTPGSEPQLSEPARGRLARELTSVLERMASRLQSRRWSVKQAVAAGVGVLVLAVYAWSQTYRLDSSPAPTPGFLMQAGGGAVGQAPPSAASLSPGQSSVASSSGQASATIAASVPTAAPASMPGEPPENSEAWSIWMVRQAYAAFAQHDYASSVQLYNRILARHPDDAIAHVGYAVTLLAMDQAPAAEAQCRAAIRIEPRFPEAHYDLAVALHREHHDAQAVAEFRRFLALAPNDKAAPAARGFIARSLLRAPSP